MKVEIIGEAGFEEALYGIGLSYGLTSDLPFIEFIDDDHLLSRVWDVSDRLCDKEDGHNKFLESMQLWISINAPRFLYSEIDTYRISTKQSESTMHTLTKRDLTQNDFEYNIPSFYLDHLNKRVKKVRENKIEIDILKNDLPEGFLQTRIWNMSYKTLRNIIKQRRKHKLLQWRMFCDYMLRNIKHKEYFEDIKGE
jgi:hypothetical protein